MSRKTNYHKMTIVHFIVFLCRKISYNVVVEWSEPSLIAFLTNLDIVTLTT